MKLVTILICVQAIFMIVSMAGVGFLMYNVNGSTKKGEEIYKENSILFYIVMALHGLALLTHAGSIFWCRK